MAHPNRLYECGCCSGLHPWDWSGDCRDDANRYGGPEEFAAKLGISVYDVEVVSMEDRLAADLDEGTIPQPHPRAKF